MWSVVRDFAVWVFTVDVFVMCSCSMQQMNVNNKLSRVDGALDKSKREYKIALEQAQTDNTMVGKPSFPIICRGRSNWKPWPFSDWSNLPTIADMEDGVCQFRNKLRY